MTSLAARVDSAEHAERNGSAVTASVVAKVVILANGCIAFIGASRVARMASAENVAQCTRGPLVWTSVRIAIVARAHSRRTLVPTARSAGARIATHVARTTAARRVAQHVARTDSSVALAWTRGATSIASGTERVALRTALAP